MKRPSTLYPLSERAPEKAVSASGMPLTELTLDRIVSGKVRTADASISAETLGMQASIARDAGRGRVAENFERAAELVQVPESVILETYEMLRPGRVQDLALLSEHAEMLRRDYDARQIADFIDEAVVVYKARNLSRPRY